MAGESDMKPTVRLTKDGRTVICEPGSRNHDYFIAAGYSENEVVAEPEVQAEQVEDKPVRRTRKKKTEA